MPELLALRVHFYTGVETYRINRNGVAAIEYITRGLANEQGYAIYYNDGSVERLYGAFQYIEIYE